MSVLQSIYEPGKRHWLKVKKDYLYGGAMADSADLVVLGAWFGTGQKGKFLQPIPIHTVTSDACAVPQAWSLHTS
jgi:ATP-dependent DNA ligase